MKNNNQVLDVIKVTVHSILPGTKILLFGSYARGDYTKDSDYDVLVVSQETFSPREKLAYRGDINKALVYALGIPVDVLINSEEEINTKKNLPCHIIRKAISEGVEL